MTATRRLSTPLFVLIALLMGCSKDLSRSRATDLIKAHKDFTAVPEVRVPVGNVWWDWRNVDGGELKALRDGGILTVRESGQKNGYWSREYLVELTPRGKELSPSWVATKEKMPGGASFMEPRCWTVVYHAEPCHEPRGTVYSVVLAKRKINEVTGIMSDAGEKEAAADFTWEWVLTGNAKNFAGRLPTGPQKGQAAFQLYDDGWRISRIEFQ